MKLFSASAASQHATFVVVWKAQAYLAQVACVAFVAFGTLWLVLSLMLTWTLLATMVYWAARQRGYPDLLHVELPDAEATAYCKMRSVACSAVKVWCAGIQALIFSRVSRGTVVPGNSGWRSFLRLAVLGLGLTLFGVSMTEHLLRRAGYAGSRLLQLSMLGAFLNVPYHVLLNAVVIKGLAQTALFLYDNATASSLF